MIGALSMWLLMVPPAEASWTPVRTLSLPGWTGQPAPVVAVDRQGDSLLVWAACNQSLTGCPFRVQARIRHSGGSMGPVTTLSPPQSEAFWPRVASGDNGDSAVVWQTAASQVMARRVLATGSLGRLQTLTGSLGLAVVPAVVADPAGRALAAWPEYRQSNGNWYAVARYFFNDGSLGPTMTLGPAGAADRLGIGIDRRGMAVVAWADLAGRVVARRIRPGHVSPLRVIMPAIPGGTYSAVSVGDDSAGDAVICFGSHNGTVAAPVHVWARRWSRTGTLGPVLHISPRIRNVTIFHAVATDLAGDSMVVWSQWINTTQTAVFGRRISATGSLGPITPLGPGDRPAVSVDDDGGGLAIWQSPGPSFHTSVYARRISRSGAFGPLIRLTSDGQTAQAASSPQGQFSVIWQQTGIRARFGP